MTELGQQMNTSSRHFVCEKGKKNVLSVSPKGKGEPVTVLACVNATGNDMAPTVIRK
jgi:hypothetical protein